MMSPHPAVQDLELYVMGNHEDLAVDDLEAHLADCRDCIAVVRREARIELALLDVARAVTECPSCRKATAGSRCIGCGAVLRAGDYRVIEVVVQNAHGRLYLAEDPDGRHVALKELAFVQTPGPDAVAAFEREAKFLRALAHPNIPRFVASFQDGDGVQTRLFLAQEYIDGESLYTRLADHWFDEDEAIDTARKVLEILVYLQELSPVVVHGDVKPANLIRRNDGSIALVDFGAARSFNATITTAVGTFGYMPIEQLAGIVNPTTDLYGLGASLVHLLSREEPWKILEDPAALGRLNVTPELRRFLAKLTARRPSDRFANARTALAALGQLRAAPKRRRMSWLAAAIAIGTVFAGGAGFGIAKLTGDDRKTAPRPPAEKVPAAPVVAAPLAAAVPAPASGDGPKLTGDFIALYEGVDGHQMLANYSVKSGVDTSSGVVVPFDLTHVVQDPKTGRWYTINDGVVGWLEWPGTFHSLELRPAPELWSPSALAFDTQRRRLVVTAEDRDQEGYVLFAYQVDTRRWAKLANIGELQPDELVYSARDDGFYALTTDSVSMLDATGNVLGQRPVDPSESEGQLVALGDQILLVSDGDVRSLDVPNHPCSSSALKERGFEMTIHGQHAGALSAFEASLRCKHDAYVVQLAFMEACSSGNSEKAKLYYKKMTPPQQQKFAQICIRQRVPYR